MLAARLRWGVDILKMSIFITSHKKEPYSYSEREFDKGSFTFFTSYNITC